MSSSPWMSGSGSSQNMEKSGSSRSTFQLIWDLNYQWRFIGQYKFVGLNNNIDWKCNVKVAQRLKLLGALGFHFWNKKKINLELEVGGRRRVKVAIVVVLVLLRPRLINRNQQLLAPSDGLARHCLLAPPPPVTHQVHVPGRQPVHWVLLTELT